MWETVNVHWLHLGLSPGYWLGNSWVSHLGKAHVHGWASALFCLETNIVITAQRFLSLFYCLSQHWARLPRHSFSCLGHLVPEE